MWGHRVEELDFVGVELAWGWTDEWWAPALLRGKLCRAIFEGAAQIANDL